MRFQVLTAASMNIAFWDTVPCSLVDELQRDCAALYPRSLPSLLEAFIYDAFICDTFNDAADRSGYIKWIDKKLKGYCKNQWKPS
jgi:hypothetical protein